MTRLTRFALLIALACGTLLAQSPPYITPVVSTLTAFVNEPYSQQFGVGGLPVGSSVQSWAITSGALPAGLSLNTATGLVTGTSTTPTETYITLTATYNTIGAGGLTVSTTYVFYTDYRNTFITPATLAPATAGLSVSRTMSVTQYSVWNVSNSNLPNSVSLAVVGTSQTAMVLSGVFPAVTSPTTYSFTLAATYEGMVTSTATRTFSILVNPAPSLSGTLPAARVGTAYNSALPFTGGTAPITFSVISSSLPPGLILNSGSGVISGTPTTVGNYSFMAQATDANSATSLRSYTITVQPPPYLITSGTPAPGVVGQAYSFPLTVSGGAPPYTWSITTGALPPGLTIGLNSGLISGTPTAAGPYFYTVTATDSQGAVATGTYTHVIAPAPLVISTTSLPDGTVGTAYASRIAAAGGTTPYNVYIVNGTLPPGLKLASDGFLSGTPTASGTFSFTAGVDDAGQQTASRTLSITVAASPAPLSISTASLPAGLSGAAYSSYLAATGGVSPYTFSLTGGALPAGLSLSPAGEIAGTPQAAGNFSFTATVTDSRGTKATKDLTLAVAAPLSFTTTTLPATEPNVAYSARLAATGGTPPYTFSLVSGSLPAGIRLASDGVFAGAATANGSFTFTARVADSARGVSDGVFVIVVQQRPAITTTTLPAATAGTAYTTTLAGTGQSPLSWSVTAGSLPAGLTLASAAGVLSGTPTAAGSYPFTVTLTDSQRLTATRDFTLQVALPALPALSVSQLPTTAAPSSQPAFGLTLASAYPLALSGTATLRFTPDSGLPADPDVRFASGGTTLNFTIPAGQTAAVPASGLFAFQAGTTAGTITLTVTLRQGATTITPDPFITRTLRVDRAAPGISSVRINRTATGFEVLVTGYSNTREISGATFTFTPASGSTLATSTFSVAVQPVFQTWFAGSGSQTYGGQFLLTVPFTVSNTSALASVSVTLTNAAGSASGSANF